MPIASGPGQSTIELITALEDERFDAMLAADIPTLERLLHKRIGYGHSNAARDTRSSHRAHWTTDGSSIRSAR
jgi:hypothetical protein